MDHQRQQEAGVGPLATVGPEPAKAVLARFGGQPLGPLERVGSFDHQLATGPRARQSAAPTDGTIPQHWRRRQGQTPPGLQPQQAREGGPLRYVLQILGSQPIAIDPSPKGLVGMDEQPLLLQGVWPHDPPFGNRALQARPRQRRCRAGRFAWGFGRRRQPGEERILMAA